MEINREGCEGVFWRGREGEAGWRESSASEVRQEVVR